jgi:PleD family two-component response regulator
MKSVKILYLGHPFKDAEIVKRVLPKVGLPFSFRSVETKDEIRQVLSAFRPDLILSDRFLSQFDSF